MCMVRRISVIALAFTLWVVGIPLPAHAAGKATRAPARVLTLHGLPLSRLLARTATGAPWFSAGVVEQENNRAGGIGLPPRATKRGLARRQKIVRGAAIGGGVGVVVGEYGFGRGLNMAHGPDMLLGAGIGAGLGALIAALATD